MSRTRRRLSFSLRTLMKMMAVACVSAAGLGWLANEWRFVRKRQAFVRSHDARVFVVSGQHLQGYDAWLRQALGDNRVEWIEFRNPDTDSRMIAQTAALFPEATVAKVDTLQSDEDE